MWSQNQSKPAFQLFAEFPEVYFKFFISTHTMSPLVVNFNQLTDLAVNPSLGTINTTLLHNLLLVIVDQLQLSSNFVELKNETVENAVASSQQGRTSKVTEYLVIDEVDRSSGELVKVRKETTKPEVNQSVKLFTVQVEEASRPSGFSSNAIQVPNVKPQHDQRSSAVAVGRKAANDEVVKLENSGNALKPTFDLINCSKRIEALEIGTRQLADIMKQFKCDCDRLNGVQSEQRREIDFLQQSIESLLGELRELEDSKRDVEASENEKLNMIRELEGTVNNFSSEIQKNLGAMASLKAQLDALTKTLDEK